MPIAAVFSSMVVLLRFSECKKQEFLEGTFDVLTGPIYDNQGELRVPEGETMTVDEILTMDWLVKGINGSVPK